MRYWIFVNNRVEGPYTIKEIVEKNFISPDLLVCPSEVSATLPSSWYFARELSEFDPYLSQQSSIAVKANEVDFDQVGLDYSKRMVEDEVNIDEIIKREKERLEKRIERVEEEDYKRKVKAFEKRIAKVEEKLRKAFSVIEDYEKRLKEKDFLIEKLEKEIEELKRIKEDEKREIEKRLKRYEDDILTKTRLIIEEAQKDLLQRVEEKQALSLKTEGRSDKDYASLELKEEKIAETPIETSIYQNELKSEEPADTVELSGVVESPSKGKEGIENISLAKAEKEVGLSEIKRDESFENKTLLSERMLTEERDTTSLAKESEFGFIDIDIKPLSTLKSDLDQGFLKEEIISSKSKDELLQTSDVDITVSSLKATSYVGDELPFQTAEINLETVNTNLDFAQGLKIEPVSVQISMHSQETVKESKEKLEEKEQIVVRDEDAFKTAKEDSKELQKELPQQDNNITVRSAEIEQISLSQPMSQPSDLEKPQAATVQIPTTKEVTDDKKTERSKQCEATKTQISERKKRSSKFLIIAGAGVVVFFFALVYILRTGSDVTNGGSTLVKKDDEKVSQAKVVKELKTETIEVQPQKEEELKIAKINENVRKAIEIVKGYDLGEGKGTIERWLSNTVASNVKGKEEWNATYLSGNIFVVQYRFLRFKAEPIVYLFEVDVEKNTIVRGINNNAINLLAGNKDLAKNGLSKIEKKVSRHIEKDEEMF